ncbi:MAG: diguanylate cyclase [Nannocystaceae bacterium]
MVSVLETKPRLILVEQNAPLRATLAGRLAAQGYHVDALGDTERAVTMCLAAPPKAVIADLWMAGISGVQLCRLLRSEAATSHVPIILRGDGDVPRNRFWAERAGAAAYVPHGRIGELVRSLSRAIAAAPEDDGFFTHLDAEVEDIRGRIAKQLDQKLYESVLAAEVRALGTCESFGRLFDLFSQFVSQVCQYRWLAVYVSAGCRVGVHANPKTSNLAAAEALDKLGCETHQAIVLEDEDAHASEATDDTVYVCPIMLGEHVIGRIALAPLKPSNEERALVELLAEELGGPIRISTLVEESQRLASFDALTGIMNRRAFARAIAPKMEDHSGGPEVTALALLDIDHFKLINDERGHASGDAVLTEIGTVLALGCREHDCVGRWGGEKFVIALSNVDEPAAEVIAEDVRARIEAMEAYGTDGDRIHVSASVGLAIRRRGESTDSLVERADQAMYAAKVAGRNRMIKAA